MKVTIHADDMGISRGISDRILLTHREGVVSRTSIAANGAAFLYAVRILKDNPGLSWALHANLTEGRCLAPPRLLPLLVDSGGRFRRGFLSLCLLPILAPWCRVELSRQIRVELNAQVQRITAALGPGALRIDGHRHIHLIPFVFQILLQQARDWGLQEIRLVREPLFTGHAGLSGVAQLISGNLIKHLLLCLFSRLCQRRLLRDRRTSCSAIRCPDGFLGVLHSGRMSPEVVKRGLKRIAVHAAGRDPQLRGQAKEPEAEVLFHPGPAAAEERWIWRHDPRQRRFYYSGKRNIETRSLLSARLRRYLAPYDWRSGGSTALMRGREES